MSIEFLKFFRNLERFQEILRSLENCPKIMFVCGGVLRRVGLCLLLQKGVCDVLTGICGLLISRGSDSLRRNSTEILRKSRGSGESLCASSENSFQWVFESVVIFERAT